MSQTKKMRRGAENHHFIHDEQNRSSDGRVTLACAPEGGIPLRLSSYSERSAGGALSKKTKVRGGAEEGRVATSPATVRYTDAKRPVGAPRVYFYDLERQKEDIKNRNRDGWLRPVPLRYSAPFLPRKRQRKILFPLKEDV